MRASTFLKEGCPATPTAVGGPDDSKPLISRQGQFPLRETGRQDVRTVVRQAFQPDSEPDKVRLESLTYNSFSEFQLAFPRRAGIGKLRPSISVQHVEGAVAVVTIDSDSRTVGFSLRTGYYLCHCSLAAYGGAGNWPEILALGDSLHPFQCGAFHGFVATQRNMAIVAFRGTETIGNALTDVKTALIRHGLFPGLVHLGFAYAADAVYPTVRTLVTSLGRGLPIWVTGHSLGGAMATLVAHRLTAEGFPVRAVYTYGSPRPGDRNFRDAYRVPNYRFVNDNDLVPHLPLRWCYRHVGHLKLLTRDVKLLEEYSDWKIKKRQLIKHAKHVQRAHRTNEDPPLKLGEFDWLADHHLDGYLAGIARLLPACRGGGIPSMPASTWTPYPCTTSMSRPSRSSAARRCSTPGTRSTGPPQHRVPRPPRPSHKAI